MRFFRVLAACTAIYGGMIAVTVSLGLMGLADGIAHVTTAMLGFFAGWMLRE